MTIISIKIRNLDIVRKNLQQIGTSLPRYMGQANQEVAREILDTRGLRRYPPATAANQPPTPYYIRGRGTQTATGNLGNSQRLGTQWFAVPYQRFGVRIGNPVTYAHHVHGEGQASHMASKGWRKLAEVAREKINMITVIYNAWIEKLIKDKGLSK